MSPCLRLSFLACVLISFVVSSPPALAADGTIQLTTHNTKVTFVGSHVVPQKPDPDARHGEFKKFTGSAVLTQGMLSAVNVSIETASLATGNDKLDAHLKSPDFFNVRQFPTATFASTKIEVVSDGKVKVIGDLTLLKETKPVSFVAAVKSDKKFKLSAEFKIDRSKYGMNYGAGKVENDVVLSISVSE